MRNRNHHLLRLRFTGLIIGSHPDIKLLAIIECLPHLHVIRVTTSKSRKTNRDVLARSLLVVSVLPGYHRLYLVYIILSYTIYSCIYHTLIYVVFSAPSRGRLGLYLCCYRHGRTAHPPGLSLSLSPSLSLYLCLSASLSGDTYEHSMSSSWLSRLESHEEDLLLKHTRTSACSASLGLTDSSRNTGFRRWFGRG